MPTLSWNPASVSPLDGHNPALSLKERERPRGGSAGALRVLVVEDDEPVRSACAGMAEAFGCRVELATSIPEARRVLAEFTFDIVFLDVRLPGGSGDLLLRELHADQPHTFVVMMTAYATVNSAVDLMRNGAGEFLQKPFALTQITEVLETVTHRRQASEASRALGEHLEAGLAAGRMVGSSDEMRKLFRMIAKVTFARHAVLIVGERGTGKELIARTIHANGPHAAAPFIPVDCDSLRPGGLEAELFGAGQPAGDRAGQQPGLLLRAGEGTVYLSEIAFLEPQVQARLVRALSDRQLQSSLSEAPVPFRARLVASSSRDLAALVDSGRFRKDLYYRLNVVTLKVPPLRERIEDIEALTELFLERQRRAHSLPFVLSREALGSLQRYDWAGNVEELEMLIERACNLSSDAFLHFGDMSTQVRNFVQTAPPEPLEPAPAMAPLISIQELERRAIQEALKQLKGDKLMVAKCLGIGKTTLYRKLKEYNLVDEGGRILA